VLFAGKAKAAEALKTMANTEKSMIMMLRDVEDEDEVKPRCSSHSYSTSLHSRIPHYGRASPVE